MPHTAAKDQHGSFRVRPPADPVSDVMLQLGLLQDCSCSAAGGASFSVHQWWQQPQLTRRHTILAVRMSSLPNRNWSCGCSGYITAQEHPLLGTCNLLLSVQTIQVQAGLLKLLLQGHEPTMSEVRNGPYKMLADTYSKIFHDVLPCRQQAEMGSACFLFDCSAFSRQNTG